MTTATREPQTEAASAAAAAREAGRKGRAIHVLHTFSCNSSVPYLQWFAERAAREGRMRYTILNMNRERPAMIEEMAALGFTCEWLPYDDRHRKRGMLRALPWMAARMRHHRPDVVHCNLFDDSLPGLIAARLAGVKARVLTRQDTGYHWMHTPRWVAADRWNGRMATDIIAISQECRDFLLEQEGEPAAKVHLVHNGIPPEVFTRQDESVKAALRARFGAEGRFPVIGNVSRFIAWKGHRLLIDAARILAARHPGLLLLLCGTGELQPEARRWVAEAGLERHVVFTGWIERGHMPSFYGILDAYLHAAEMEPFGLVIAEAMMNAVPVASTRTGAARDAIADGINGVLASERTGPGLADAVERLLAADRHALGRAGRDTALRIYHFDRMWEGTLRVYEQALSRA